MKEKTLPCSNYQWHVFVHQRKHTHKKRHPPSPPLAHSVPSVPHPHKIWEFALRSTSPHVLKTNSARKEDDFSQDVLLTPSEVIIYIWYSVSRAKMSSWFLRKRKQLLITTLDWRSTCYDESGLPPIYTPVTVLQFWLLANLGEKYCYTWCFSQFATAILKHNVWLTLHTHRLTLHSWGRVETSKRRRSVLHVYGCRARFW